MSIALMSTLAFAISPVPPPAEAVAAPPFPSMPEAGAPPVFEPPVPTVAKLANGVPVWVIENHVLPLVSVVLTVPGGSGTDPEGKAGRATLSDQMMRQGAGELSAEAFADLVEQQAIELDVSTSRESSSIIVTCQKDKLDTALSLVADLVLRPTYAKADLLRERSLEQAALEQAIELDVSTSRESSTITVTCQKDKLDTALSLVADLVLRPTYAKADLLRERSLEQAALEQAMNDPGARASQVAWSAWWGDGHPYATPPEGLPSELGKLKPKDVKAYHALAWTPTGATITAAGDLTSSELVAALDPRLAGWEARPAAEVDAPPPPAHGGGLIAVDRPDSTQTTLYLLFRGEPFGAPRSAPLDLGAVVLGGTFTSRLNAKLREEKGYTYGARAATLELLDGGVVVVSTRVRADATGEALKDLLAELERVQSGITAEELGKAQGAWRQDLLQALETRSAAASTYAQRHRARLAPGAVAERLEEMAAIDRKAVDDALKALAPGSDRVVVLVGDRKTLEQELPEQGLPAPTWAD